MCAAFRACRPVGVHEVQAFGEPFVGWIEEADAHVGATVYFPGGLLSVSLQHFLQCSEVVHGVALREDVGPEIPHTACCRGGGFVARLPVK